MKVYINKFFLSTITICVFVLLALQGTAKSLLIVTVKDANGPISDIEVYVGNQVLGKTNEKGRLEAEGPSGELVLSAQKKV